MNHPFSTWVPISRALLAFALFFGGLSAVFAEGSADFVNRPGYRLHLVGNPNQQFKVYAMSGEFINVGSSNLEAGGTIKVYKPSGVLATIFDQNTLGPNGRASIDSLSEEISGPIGKVLGGFTPGAVPVGAGETGVWTVVFTCSSTSTVFTKLLNNQDWHAQADQTVSMTIIAWDVTVSKNASADAGGLRLKGRLYSQELSVFNQEIGDATNPIYYVLTRDGYLYKVSLLNLDPLRFWFSSNNVGIVRGDTKEPYYKSVLEANYTISSDVANWQPNGLYYYDPQEPDNGLFVNNKVFLNPPAADLPADAQTTNVFSNNTYSTWLKRDPTSLAVTLGGFTIGGSNGTDTCFSGSIQQGIGGTFHFASNQSGVAEICLDVNNNGSYADAVDRKVYGDAVNGPNNIFWDGKDGLGNDLPNGNLTVPYKLSIRAGGMHILYRDVENSGGFQLALQNTNLGATDLNSFFFDHSEVGGGVSGNGTPGNPLPQTGGDTYFSNFGDMKLMNYWKFYQLAGSLESSIVIIITDDCVEDPPPPVPTDPDHDGDGIVDSVDLDDDNDGVPDRWEYCNPAGSFACLPNAADPSGDADSDDIPNFQDANDPAYPNPCADANSDGRCDNLPAIFDLDGDGVADHHDLDSDNDGITDLVEAGHFQADADGNGVIDGLPAAFGPNGLFDPIDTDPLSLTSTGNYTRWDFDGDGVPDHDDLDSDNDGIHDVIEAEFYADSDGDGRLDGPSNTDGIASQIDPATTGNPIPNPIDTDSDNTPDWHDLDTDNDGIWDVMEGGISDPDFDGIVGTGTPAVNANGQATAGTTSDPTNTDGDPLPDFRELDSDNDHIPDADECSTGTPCRDWDGDGHPDFQDKDRDNDGIDDDWECETSVPCVDTDLDGTPDVDDLDSDGDNQYDSAECPTNGPCPDGDMNGIPDFRQFDCSVVVPGGTPTMDNVSGSGTYCAGSSVTIQGQNLLDTITGPVFYIFEDSDGNSLAAGFLANVTDVASFTFTNIADTSSGVYTLLLAGKNGCASPPGIYNIIVGGSPDAPNLTASNETPCDGGTTTLSIPPVSGAGVTYEWFFNGAALTTTAVPNLDLTNFAAANAGEYSVQVSGASGCAYPPSNSLNVGITETPGDLTAQNSTNGPVCEGGSATLSLPNVPGATYAWSGPNGFVSNDQNPEISPLTVASSGDYSAIVTLNGCAFPSTATMLAVNAQPAVPVLSTPSDPLCAGSDVLLETAAPPGSGVAYEWFFNGNPLTTTSGPSLTLTNYAAANAGSYTVLVNGGTCASPASNSLVLGIIDPGVALTASISTSGNCEGDAASLNIPDVPGASYLWVGPNGFTSNAFSPLISPLTLANSGNYSAIVTLGGCSFPSTNALLNVTAQPATPVLTAGPNPACAGSDVVLQTASAGSGATYDWFFNNLLLTSTTSPTLALPDFAAGNAGEYWVAISNGTCFSQPSNALDLGIVDPGVALTASNSLPGPVCEGGSANLFLQTVAGATYAWTGPNGFTSNLQNPVISPLTAANSGSYSAIVSLGGCTFPSTSTNLTVNAQPGTPVLTTQNDKPCAGSTVVLQATNAGAGVTYQWFFNGNPLTTTSVPTLSVPNFLAANAGNYTVLVNGGTCSSPVSNTLALGITTPGVALTAGNDAGNGICAGGPVNLTLPNVPGATYAWTGPGGFTSNQQNPTISPATVANSGAYQAIVTLNGCQFPSTSTNVVVNATPATPVLSVSTTAPCPGSTVMLSVQNVPGANYLFSFVPTVGVPIDVASTVPTFSIPNFSAANNGQYSVIVQVNGCASGNSNTVTLNAVPPPGNLTATNNVNGTACEGASATLNLPTLPGATYQWAGPNGFTSNAQNPLISPLTVGNLGSYTATVTVNGCPFPATATSLAVSPTPAAAQIGNNGPVCSNGTGVLTVSNPTAGATYRWFDALGNSLGTTTAPTFTLPAPPVGGNYTVQAEIGGCASAFSLATNLVVDQLPTNGADLVSDLVYSCNQPSAAIAAVPPTVGTGQWAISTPQNLTFANANAAQTTVSGLQWGISNVTWTLSSGACANYSTVTLQIVNEPPANAQPDNYTLAQGTALTGANIAGNDALSTTLDASTIEITSPPAHGTASLVDKKLNYTPSAGFSGTDVLTYRVCSSNCPDLCSTTTVTITIEGGKLVIPNIITPNGDGKNDGLVIQGLDSYTNNRLCVFNRYGHLIIDEAPYLNDWKGTWKEEDLPAGTYFIMLFPDKGQEKTVIKQYMTIVR